MADSESILQLGIEAARAGDKTEARDLFRLVTREDPNNAQGWLWLAGVAEDREEKRAALERVIHIDPNNELARKGLAAVTGRTTAALPVVDAAATPPAATPPVPVQPPTGLTVASTVPAVAPPQPVSPPAVPPPDRVGSPTDLEFAASLDSMDLYDQVDAGGAKTYFTPAAVAAGAAAGALAGNRTPPDADDSYDLSDYQNRPAATANDDVALDDGQSGTVVVEDEPQRSGLPPWVTPLVGVLAVVLIAALLFSRCSGGNVPIATLPTRTATGLDATSGLPAVLGTTAPLSDSGTLGGAGVGPTTTDSAALGTTSTGPTTGFDATLSPSAPAASSPLAVESAGVGQTAATGQTTIILEGSGTVQPGDQTAVGQAGNGTAVAASANPVQSAAPSTPTAAPSAPPAATAPPNPPASNADLGAANPQTVPATQRITANAWNYVWNYGFGQLKAVGTSNYGGVRPTHGQWLAITMAAANTSGQPTKIPDGYFVLKDSQNRVYEFNRAASADWFNRFGGRGNAADISANDPFTTDSTSTILLFDVPPDASNLVLFSRDNLNQGYMIR